MGASDVVSFQTTGGDWYLVIANGRDNMDNPNVDSLVLRWNGTAFEQSQVEFGFKLLWLQCGHLIGPYLSSRFCLQLVLLLSNCFQFQVNSILQ